MLVKNRGALCRGLAFWRIAVRRRGQGSAVVPCGVLAAGTQRMARLVVAVASALALGGAGSAAAQPSGGAIAEASGRRVALVTVPAAGAPQTAAELLAAARTALPRGAASSVGDGVALARAARQAGAVPAAQLAALARVIEAGAEGWRAYLQVAVPFAASRLGKARSDAEALLPLPGGLELYADLSLRLGAALLSLGRVDEAEDAFALSATLDGDREVSLVEFSPDIVEAVARVKKRQGASAELVVTVEGSEARSEPRGVARSAPRSAAAPSIEIDGVAMAPVSVTATASGGVIARFAVARGQHVIVVRRRGYEDAAQAVRVPEGGAEAALILVEDRLARALADAAVALAGMSEDRALSLVEAVLTYGDADEVLLVAASSRRGAPALLAQRCGASLRCTAVVEIGYTRPGLAPAMRAAWAALERGELRYPPSLPSDARVLPDRASAGDGKCRLCRSPWLWAGVGATVAISSAVLIYLLGQEQPPPALTVDPGEF